jgi:hypothetical protein
MEAVSFQDLCLNELGIDGILFKWILQKGGYCVKVTVILAGSEQGPVNDSWFI